MRLISPAPTAFCARPEPSPPRLTDLAPRLRLIGLCCSFSWSAVNIWVNMFSSLFSKRPIVVLFKS
uniref:Uncharacterized protein n=1 Tax=Cynoglossus semilaevis TaxID=244447 RepID=A0A3P8X219_CYNSE